MMLLNPLLSFLCVCWIIAFLYLMRAITTLPQLDREQSPTPKRWPRLSIVVPACNEAEHLESAMTTLLRQDYPDLEIILINDRSTDATGEIIDRLAKSDPRVNATHIRTLPTGWLGKVHALHCGVARATGEWLVFTDADVGFASCALRRAVAFSLDNGIDHLALIPRTIQRGFLLDIVVHAFGLLFLLGTRAASINQPGSRAFVGVGACNLVRTDSFRRTPGFGWLRLEPCDDMGLGLMIKRAGGRSHLAFSRADLTVEWYSSVPAMFKGLEKNLFAGAANYRWWLMSIVVATICFLAAAPPVSFLVGWLDKSYLLTLTAGATVAIHFAVSLRFADEGWKSILSSMLFPVGLGLLSAMLLRAGWKCLRNGGIDWRGTRYPLDQLRAGQRVKLWRAGRRPKTPLT